VVNKEAANISEPDQHSVKRIFILRPDNLGDVILFIGALRVIREQFKEAHITICVKRYARNLLEKCPYLDEIVTWESYMDTFWDHLPEFKGKWRVRRAHQSLSIRLKHPRSNPYDLFLLPLRNTLPEMHLFAEKLPAKRKVAIDTETTRPDLILNRSMDEIYNQLVPISEKRKMDHEFNVHRDFLNALGGGASKDDLHPEIFTDESDREWAASTIKREAETPLIAICPGVTSLDDKFYAAENYRDILKHLHAERLSIAIFGSPAETTQCMQVEEAIRSLPNLVSIQNVAGKSTVRQLAEGFKKCDLVLSNETAALHLATALKKPTVGVVGGGYFGRFYPWGDPDFNLTAFHRMECFYCSWDCIYPEIRCIHEIQPGKISDLIQQLLDRQQLHKN